MVAQCNEPHKFKKGVMKDETRIEIDKHFDAIMNLIDDEKDERLKSAYDDVRNCGILLSEFLDDLED